MGIRAKVSPKLLRSESALESARRIQTPAGAVCMGPLKSIVGRACWFLHCTNEAAAERGRTSISRHP
jgi:hypothetical protein